MSRRFRFGLLAAIALVAVAAFAAGCGSDDDEADSSTVAGEGNTLFIESTIALDTESAVASVTLPLFEGRAADGQTVWYVITDSSDEGDADERGVIFAPKLANALGTKAVQRVSDGDNGFEFAGTVDFAPERAVTPGPDGFPPDAVTPGAVGDANYSPLVTTDGEIVLNATQVQNDSGTHDSVVDIDTEAGEVTLKLLRGFFAGQNQVYLRLDASADVVAALEESIYAPNLGEAPGEGVSGAESARSPIIPIVNGARGADNPERQGLQSAVLGEGEPLNIQASTPGGEDYSPAWDVTPAVWTPEAIAAGEQVLVTSAEEITAAVTDGWITSAGEGAANPDLGGLKALGAISNCPTVATIAA